MDSERRRDTDSDIELDTDTHIYTHRSIDRRINRQTDRHIDRQIDREIEIDGLIESGSHTVAELKSLFLSSWHLPSFSIMRANDATSDAVEKRPA